MMATWALAAASGLYLLTAWDYAKKGDPGMCLAFLSYSLANAGFIWAGWR